MKAYKSEKKLPNSDIQRFTLHQILILIQNL